MKYLDLLKTLSSQMFHFFKIFYDLQPNFYRYDSPRFCSQIAFLGISQSCARYLALSYLGLVWY